MTEKAEDKVEALPDLDDLLQCPVCYEIPSGQIFQCNEGHHVCGRCKMRLDVCPVCRAFFFGTRNYAMEELIANVKKLRAFKLGGKVTTGTPPAEVTAEARESSSEDNESLNENANEEDDVSSRASSRPPAACKGLFRCLCCKNNPERLPLGRLLNHLRYYHSPDLIEGRSENGGYLQAWQFPTAPGRVVTAVRVHDMGIFFLVIEVAHESVHAWMSMAAAPWVAHEFTYSFTLSGNDREAIFSDCVWSVRSCEGTLKKRGRCLTVRGADARALLAPTAMSGKLSVRRAVAGAPPRAAEPRAVLRVANRSNAPADVAHDLEPFLQDLQNDVARLSRAFATLGREANALVRSEAEMRARFGNAPAERAAEPQPAEPQPAPDDGERLLSRSARRRMRQRLREAFRESQAPEPPAPATAPRPAPPPTLAPRPAPPPTLAPRPAPPPTLAPRPLPNCAVPRAVAVNAAPRTAPPPLAAAPRLAPRPLSAAPRPSPLLAASRPIPPPVSNQPTRPTSNQNVSRPQNSSVVGNGARVPNGGRVDAARPTGSNLNVVPPRGNSNQNINSGRGADGQAPQVVHIGYIRVVSPTEAAPPPVAPPPSGGSSQDRPTNGNSRNKKKRRQRR